MSVSIVPKNILIGMPPVYKLVKVNRFSSAIKKLNHEVTELGALILKNHYYPALLNNTKVNAERLR